MALTWCAVCSSGHSLQEQCPGELPATGPERHGWRVNAETPRGIVAHGVMIVPSVERVQSVPGAQHVNCEFHRA